MPVAIAVTAAVALRSDNLCQRCGGADYLQILNEIAQHKIKIYEFPDCDDEEEAKIQKKLKVSQSVGSTHSGSGSFQCCSTNQRASLC